MGMIALLEVVYKIMVLTLLLEIFNAEGGYKSAHQDHAHQHRGCQGIHYSGKPHILDAMHIIHDLCVRLRLRTACELTTTYSVSLQLRTV